MASVDLNWRPRSRDYELERKRLAGQLEETTDHPLQALVSSVETTTAKTKSSKAAKQKEAEPAPVSDPLSGAAEVIDPLSSFSPANDPLSAALLDPLSQAASEVSSFGTVEKKKNKVVPDVTFEPWSVKRTTILSTYTTSQKIPITTSFLSNEEREKLETKAQAAAGDKVKHRLEQLDDLEEGSVKETLNLGQKEYVKKIDGLNKSLIAAWDNDQRVKALKISIQCSKLLSDVSVIQFYPSKFVLITDILDNFGALVFDRIRRKSQYTPPGSIKPIMLPEDFDPKNVPESGKETCRNWFYKISSIRELLPRFYVEAAILKCYSFLTNQEFTQALIRLTKMIRGIGDPLVACYARAYLCRVGLFVAPNARTHLMPNFTDYLYTVQQWNTDHVQNTLAVQRLDLPDYIHLYVPAIEWILQCVAHKAAEPVLEEVIGNVREGVCSAVVVNAIINSFQPRFISHRALMFAELIKDCEETGLPKYKLYVSLGHCVVAEDPPEKDRLQLLNAVWKNVVKFRKPSEYIACTQVWIEYVAKHFTKREVNTLLDDVIKHMMPERAFESHYSDLVSIINRIMAHMTDFYQVFSMDKFLPFIDLLQKESVRVEVCKTIIRSFTLNHKEETSDPLIKNGLTYLCKIVHDSLNALSLEDERRQCSQLICGFIQKVSFGRDFEQQLGFFVEARANFSNLDQVLVFLIHRVNLLAMETRRLVKCNHSRKTAAFVRACVAYTFITIPSVSNVLSRLNLFVLSGRVAVANGALSQGDAFFKAAINALKDVPQYVELDHKRILTEGFVMAFLNNFLSTLLVIPDNPDHEALYLLRGLLNGMQEYQWGTSTDHKVKVFLNTTNLLAAACQEQYIYTVEKVDSNDSLYAGDPKLVNEVSRLFNTVLQQILDHMKNLATSDELRPRQAKLALGLFLRLSVHADMSEGTNLKPLLVNLWNLAQKHGILDQDLLARCRRACLSRTEPEFKSLSERLTLPSSV